MVLREKIKTSGKFRGHVGHLMLKAQRVVRYRRFVGWRRLQRREGLELGLGMTAGGEGIVQLRDQVVGEASGGDSCVGECGRGLHMDIPGRRLGGALAPLLPLRLLIPGPGPPETLVKHTLYVRIQITRTGIFS